MKDSLNAVCCAAALRRCRQMIFAAVAITCTSPLIAEKVYRDLLPNAPGTVESFTSGTALNATQTSDTLSSGSIDHNLVAELIFQHTNQERTNAGLQPVIRDEVLRNLAESHSRDMAARSYFSHTGPGGIEPGKAFEERVPMQELGFRRTGENITLQPVVKSRRYSTRSAATGTTSRTEELIFSSYDELTRQSVANWMKSDGHRRNILNPDFNHIGIGAAVGVHEGSPYAWITQIFAQK